MSQVKPKKKKKKKEKKGRKAMGSRIRRKTEGKAKWQCSLHITITCRRGAGSFYKAQVLNPLPRESD